MIRVAVAGAAEHDQVGDRGGAEKPPCLRAAVAAGFLGSGILHFTQTRWYESIMPPYIPRHREMVHVSGVAELVGGAGLLVPATRRIPVATLARLIELKRAGAPVLFEVLPQDVPGLGRLEERRARPRAAPAA